MSMAFSRKIIFIVGVYGVVKWPTPLTLVYNALWAGYKARPASVDVLKPVWVLLQGLRIRDPVRVTYNLAYMAGLSVKK